MGTCQRVVYLEEKQRFSFAVCYCLDVAVVVVEVHRT